jgi:preprotein translocase subunit SecF
VRDALGDTIEIRRVEVVGPGVSNELKQAGIMAVCFAIIGILLYVWFRFEWQFGVAAIVALIHDIMLTLGAFSILGLDFGLNEVAALLTLAGYSINDTVVIFDRVRENLRRYKKMPLIDLVNLSLNETLSRTIVTSVSTFLAVLAIYAFGSEVIHGFSFAMLFGIVVGVWSTIIIATPVLVWLGVKRDWSEEAAAARTRAPKEKAKA